MEILFKKFYEDAKAPVRATEQAAGLDLFAHRLIKLSETEAWYGTGIGISIPNGTVGFLCPRSSVSEKDLRLANSVGVLDPDYTGEIQFRFDRFGDDIYGSEERLGQIVVVNVQAHAQLREVDEFEETQRGEGGFGSTDFDEKMWEHRY